MIEPEFTAQVASWIDEILRANPQYPFSEARCEQRDTAGKKRDLTILGKNKKPILTGEVKLPYALDGGSPYNEKVVNDAYKKASRAKTDYYFTWNVNECVLWERYPAKKTSFEREYKSWEVTHVTKPEHLEHPKTERDIKQWLHEFLSDFANIIHGNITFEYKKPDEKFVEALESYLKLPISLTFEELEVKYNNKRTKVTLDTWMREEQGWTISDDPQDVRENLERAAKFTCYALVNKLVFYEALRRRYGTIIKKLKVPNHIEAGEDLRLHLEKYFEEAKKGTGDYETVFGEDRYDIGIRIPFYSDKAVGRWRELIQQIHHFDFGKLDYEIIGNIFERLISPEERHKYGQYYTRPEIVDLINSFCIQSGDEKVLDPACGGGTFLVRAYARKRILAPDREHGRILTDLYGVDISHFATHLTTINLATRDLIHDENYPQIARSDFFDVQSGKPLLHLPQHASGARIRTTGLGKAQQRDVLLPPLDAIIGNPPYVRQEDIRKTKRNGTGESRGTKEHYRAVVAQEWPHINLSGRSDLHCYFWPHATTFLKEDGYFCFLPPVNGWTLNTGSACRSGFFGILKLSPYSRVSTNPGSSGRGSRRRSQYCAGNPMRRSG